MADLNPRRVLVVDDEENVCKALRRTLRREGYQVEVMTDPTGVLDFMAHNPIDAFLSDHLMPNMTGMELLGNVRTRFPDCLRVMLTGHADMQTAIDAINHGEIYRFITKPWDDTELKVMLFNGFEKLDLERENRSLLSMVRRQAEQFRTLEQQFPGISPW